MEMEKKILGAALADRSAYNKLITYGSEEDLSEQGKLIWKEVEGYYELDTEADTIDKDIIISRLVEKYPKHSELFTTIVSSIEKVSVPNILEDALRMKEYNLKDKLSAAFASGTGEQIESLLEDYRAIRKADGELNNKVEVYNNVDICELLKATDSSHRIKVLPMSLNRALRGGVLRKHHIVIFAPTEMGKSLLTLNMVHGFLKQNLRVLYCGNEDPAEDMLIRLAARVGDVSLHDLDKYPDKVKSFLKARNWDNFYFVELAPGTPQEIEACVEEYKPDILIVDQIRNLEMGEKHNFVRTLEAAAQFMRRIGKQYNLVSISLTQAADSATGKNLLSRGDIDNSNVGIPGTADLMIGLGANQDTENSGYRWLSLVKNKVSGNKEPIQVKINILRTKVE